jgi:hypothetical protein
MWVAIHKCMEAMLGISLYSYLYPKLAKTLSLSYYLLCFLINKIGEEGRTGSAWGRGGGAQTIYTHVNKCKNDKIKGEKKKRKFPMEIQFINGFQVSRPQSYVLSSKT